MIPQFSNESVNILADILQKTHGFSTTGDLDRAVSEIIKKTQARSMYGQTPFSLSTMIRGLRALRNEVLNPSTAEQDVQYVKALSTGSTPGS